ncbi:MAG: Ig-like domain-containing protein [Desulfuromonadaceae bacterium]|nr:Ig-like domain-containing protein [Desulfuromonadaceae bacterium]
MKCHTLKILFYACIFSIVTATASQARDVTLQWDPSTDSTVTGYKVNYNADSATTPFSGAGATQGSSPYDAKKVTTATLTGLDPNRTYYFAVTAYNATGTQSSYSNIVSVAEATPPTISITAPAANTTISGTVSVTASATDNVGVTKVEYYLNGTLKTTDTSTPYVYSLNTTSLASGTYMLMAKAYDAAGNVGQSSNVSVTVVNDTTAPTVSLTTPANNATVSGTTTITASASDNVGVSKVEFYRSGTLLYAANVAPFSYAWNTATVTNGSYTLTAKAYDNTGNVATSANVVVTVNNVVADVTAPVVSVTAPATGATVSGTVSVAASASDNSGVSKVEFYVNGALKATDTASPYTYSWNTALVSNGSYNVMAKAYDAAGNIGQSASVSATVNNGVTPPAGTITAVFGNVAGSNYANTVEDTFLQLNTNANATSTALNTYTWPAAKPANAILMNWDLSALPAGAVIQSATLSLYMSASGGDALYEMPVSGIINKMPIIAKSNGTTYDGTNAWTASSVPYNSIPLAQSDIATAVDAPLIDKTIGYKNWNVTSLVKGWVATPGNNKGLLLNSSSKASSDSNRVFVSSEASDNNQRPKLVVTYTLPSSDTTAPAVAITAPGSSTTVSGTLAVSATASDNVAVAKVEFYVNGTLQTSDTASPYSFSWNTSSLVNGSYSITAKAYDAAGNVGQSAAGTVTVNNIVADTTAPITAITSPATNATVSGTVNISASASDSVGVSKVEFYVNGALKATDTASPYTYSWNTALVSNGSYNVMAKAYDAAGNIGQSASVSATVNNGVTPPAGTITAVFGNVAGSNYANTVEDTFLQLNTNANATSTALNTYTWPAAKPANAILMNWDLSALPAGAVIQSATLSLYMSASGGDALYEMPVSGIINKMPIIAKSNGTTYDGTNAWTASSVPYNSIPLAQSDIATAVDAPLIDKTIGYKNWNVTSLVKGWVATPGNNKGLLLNSSSKASSDSNRVFVSSEASDNNQRPKLVVTYTLPSSDTTAPAVAITAPGSSTTVSGTLAVSATASDNVAVAKVEFYVNGTLQTSDTASPYSFSWNTSSLVNGSYSITAKAYDAAGNVGQSSAVQVTVSNAVTDTVAPSVTITSPSNRSTVKGTVCAAVSASDNVGVTKVEYFVNGSLNESVAASPFGYCITTTAAFNGTYTMYAKAYDAAGNVKQSRSVKYTIKN